MSNQEALARPSIIPNISQPKRRRWYAALIIVTLLPLLGLPVLHGAFELPFRQSFALGLGVFVGGLCHVASTVYFYFDGESRKVMSGMKPRFYALPTAVIGLSIAALVFGSQINIPSNVVLAVFFIHLIWLYFHYQKQNYGLLAFAAASSGHRLPRSTVNVLLLPPLAGGLASIPQLLAVDLHQDLFFMSWVPVLHTLSIVVYLIAAFVMLTLAVRNRQVFSQPLVCLFSIIAFGFFLPALFIKDLEYAFWSYAIAHGLQYLLMVGIVSAQNKIKILGLIAFFITAIVGGWLLKHLSGNDALFICGILLTWVHFILDARLWRMSDSNVRPFLRSRFSFIFNR